MIIKCNNCEPKPFKKCCDKCRDQPYKCFVCDIIIKERDRTNHLSKYYTNPDLYKTCCSCKIYKQISYFRYKTENRSLCT